MENHFRTIRLDAGRIAIELGNAKCMNVVLFGAMCDALGVDEVDWESVVAETVPQKVRELNVQAFRLGRAAAQK
jgi:indolepyruvate ferredoxin oxidoreductase beta subunit